jgi:2-isopropylmalate synthase
MDYSNSNLLDERKTIKIFDTTLRDGEQSALCTMFMREKLEIAEKLEEIGVDIIEAGFAASSLENFETIQKVSQQVRRPYVCSLSRCKTSDINSAYESLRNYEKRMIHLFMPTSEIQVFEKMGKNYSEIERMIIDSMKQAKKYFEKIEFSCEDATRTEIQVLEKIYGVAINEGASIINIPDTLGCVYPEEYGQIIYRLTNFAKKINPDVKTSVHCHQDLGLAGINSFYGIINGAEQVECTVNGIGERAGNCAVEQIMAHEITTKKFKTNLRHELIKELSDLVSLATDTKNDFAAITGTCAFSHKAGIHQHGVVVNSKTYEALDAGHFGRKTEIILGPHSGHHGVIAKAKQLGYEINPQQAASVLELVSEQVRQEKTKRFSDQEVGKIIQDLLKGRFKNP